MVESKPGLFEELKRRNVFRVAAMYSVVGWLLLQVGEVTFEPLGMPEGSLRALILLVALGFPVAVVLGWIYDWTPEGLVRTPDDPAAEVVRLRRGRRMDYAIIGVLVAALALMIWSPELRTSASSPRAAAPAEFWERPAIAVLPFVALGDDPEHQYFAEGLSEEISSRLAVTRAFPVIARSSTLAYRDPGRNAQQVSTELGARYVVDGSVRRLGDRARMSVSLIDGQNGAQLWTHSEELASGEEMEVSTQVVQSVVMAIDHRLWVAEGSRAVTRPPANAWDLHMRGAWLFDRYEYGRAVALFEQAMEADPAWGRPPASMANVLATWVMNDPSTAPPDALTRASALAERAHNLAPDEWYVFLSLGIANFQQDGPRARMALRNAVELNPSDLFAHVWLGLVYIREGEFEQAILQVDHALRVAPRANFPLYVLAAAHYLAGRPEAAREPAEQLIGNGNNAPRDLALMAVIYVELGLVEKARGAIAAARVHPDYTPESMLQHIRPDQRDRLGAALSKAGWVPADELPAGS